MSELSNNDELIKKLINNIKMRVPKRYVQALLDDKEQLKATNKELLSALETAKDMLERHRIQHYVVIDAITNAKQVMGDKGYE